MTKIAPDNSNKTRIKAMTARMMSAYKVDKKQLADIFDCKTNVINNWPYYDRTPYPYLDRCSQDTGVTMDWLINGTKTPQAVLTKADIVEIKTIVKGVVQGALDYGVIDVLQPGAEGKIIEKLEKDLSTWHNKHTDLDDDGAVDQASNDKDLV